jgi:hypothetical protein
VAGEFDRNKSLQELEHVDLGEPPLNSHLVKTIHRLHRKPLAQFDVEDLRIVIGQGMSLPYLIPLALEVLEEDPLADGDFFRGDLLKAVLDGGQEYWSSRPELVQRLRKIIHRAKERLPALDTDTERQIVLEFLAEAPPSVTQ